MTIADDFVGVKFDLPGDGWVYYLGRTHQEIIDGVDWETRQHGWKYLQATKLSKEECLKAIPNFSLEASLSRIDGAKRYVQSDMKFPREEK